MKKYYIALMVLVACIAIYCVYYRDRTPKEDEFSLFVYMFGTRTETEKLQLYHNDVPIFSRKLKLNIYDDDPQMIFVSNLKKGEVTNLRFKLEDCLINGHKIWKDIDTTFSISTVDSDSTWISYTWSGALSISDISPLTEFKKRDDEFALFVYLYPPYFSEEMQVYHNDTLLYDGKIRSLYYDPYLMFVSNVKKGEMTRLRLKSVDVDTTFSLSTMDIDSIKMGIASSETVLLFDNHAEDAWLYD